MQVLNELGCPEKLNYLIAGESLLNDGTAVVAFFVMQGECGPMAPSRTVWLGAVQNYAVDLTGKGSDPTVAPLARPLLGWWCAGVVGGCDTSAAEVMLSLLRLAGESRSLACFAAAVAWVGTVSWLVA
jgi:hypothetical protein